MKYCIQLIKEDFTNVRKTKAVQKKTSKQQEHKGLTQFEKLWLKLCLFK